MAVSSFKFSGGGSSFRYFVGSVDTKKTTTFSNGIDEDDEHIDPGDKTFTVFNIGLKVKVLLKYDYKKITKSSPYEQTVTNHNVGFILSDPDIGDEFIVDVFIDPVHKTYIFHTVGGASKCPHEEKTMARENPVIQINGLLFLLFYYIITTLHII